MNEADLDVDSLPLFTSLPAPSRAALLGHAVMHAVAPGTVLFEQGEMPNFLLIVLSGSVHLMGQSSTGDEVLVEVVEPPDLVIPAATLTKSPYLMRGYVPGPSRLLMIEADAFRTAVLQEPALAQAVIGCLAGQFRRLVRQIKNLKLRSAQARTGCYLLALASRQGTTHRAVLPYGKHLIASELGMTRESFSRALSALRSAGISVDGENITIRDPQRLAAVCGLDPLIDGPETSPQTSSVMPPKITRTTRSRQ